MPDNGNNPPTKGQVTGFIKNQKDERIRYFTIIKNAAASAARRFLGRRVTLIEQKLREADEVSATGLFVDVLIHILIGPVAGGILNKLTERAFRSVIVPRQTFLLRITEKTKVKYKFTTDHGRLKSRVKVTKLTSRKLKQKIIQPQNSSEYEFLKVSADAIVEALVEVASDEARSFERTPSRPQVSDEEPTGLVEVIENYADAQMMVSNKIYNFFDSRISADEFSRDTVNLIHKFLSSEEIALNFTEEEWREMKDRYIRLFEAVMWVAYLGELAALAEVTKVRVRAGETPMGMGGSLRAIEFSTPVVSVEYEKLIVREPKLLKYLLKRFRHPDGNGKDNFVQHFYRREGRGSLADQFDFEILYEILTWQNKQLIGQELLSYLEQIKGELNQFKKGRGALGFIVQ